MWSMFQAWEKSWQILSDMVMTEKSCGVYLWVGMTLRDSFHSSSCPNSDKDPTGSNIWSLETCQKVSGEQDWKEGSVKPWGRMLHLGVRTWYGFLFPPLLSTQFGIAIGFPSSWETNTCFSILTPPYHSPAPGWESCSHDTCGGGRIVAPQAPLGVDAACQQCVQALRLCILLQLPTSQILAFLSKSVSDMQDHFTVDHWWWLYYTKLPEKRE